MKKLRTVFVAVAILTITFALAGCSTGGTFTAKAYASNDAKIEAVTINAQDRQITVSASDDSQIYIDYFESEKEYYDISVSKDNTLTMDFLENKGLTDYIGMKASAEYRKINIKIPYSLLSNLTIVTTNADIKLSPIAVSENISLSCSGGNIEFEGINPGQEVTLTAKNGNIKGTIIGSYDLFAIKCEIKKGKCNLPLEKTDGEKSLKANCNNGDIKIDFVKEQA